MALCGRLVVRKFTGIHKRSAEAERMKPRHEAVTVAFANSNRRSMSIRECSQLCVMFGTLEYCGSYVGPGTGHCSPLWLLHCELTETECEHKT